MIKINKFKKQTDRLLVVSEKKLYKVDAAKIKVILSSTYIYGDNVFLSIIIIIQHYDNEHDDAGDEGGGAGAGDGALLWHRGQPNGQFTQYTVLYCQ